jgi:MFS transporter, DHA1 family, multidrug resistance protein
MTEVAGRRPPSLDRSRAFGALFAYVSGSSPFLINIVGLRPEQYGLVFAATSLGIMGGAFVNSRLSASGVLPDYLLSIGLGLAALSATSLLAMTLADWMPLPPSSRFWSSAPWPFWAHRAERDAGCHAALAADRRRCRRRDRLHSDDDGRRCQRLVAALYNGSSALSMTAVMALCSLLALISYPLLARPAERVDRLRAAPDLNQAKRTHDAEAAMHLA